MESVDKKRKFIINVIYFAMIVAFGYLILQYVVPVMMPFIIAFVIVWFMKIPAKWIAKKTNLPEHYLRMITVAIFYGIIVTLIMTVGFKISDFVKNFANDIPSFYQNKILPIISQVYSFVEENIAKIEPDFLAELEKMFTQLLTNLGQFVTKLSVTLVKVVSNFATRIPSLFIKLIITIVSSFFIAADYDKLFYWLNRIMPDKTMNGLRTLKKYAADVLIQYLRSYFLIFCITCVELSIGLSILKIPYPIGIAIIIAIFDIMPIVGLGGVLIPWAVIALVLTKYKLAIGLLILYIIITVIRNVIEPKIIGMQIGLPPLATLVGMVVGLNLFGIIGLFGIPITLSICLQLHRKGLLHLPKWFLKKEKVE